MEDFRAASVQTWSAVAPDWGELIARVDRQLGAAADWMIDAVALEPGERILELAAGPGTMTLMAARETGPGGRLICTDFAEPMVDVGRRRLGEAGIANVDFRVLDAQEIDLPDGAVDVALCRMGYMLMADPAAALGETARVLAPGGRLALAVWAGPEANPWAALLMQAIMRQLGAPAPPPGTPGLWALADRDGLERLLGDAGLGSIRIEEIDDVVEYDSTADWFEMTARLAGPVRTLLANLDVDARAAVERSAAEAAAPYQNERGGLSMPERILVAAARRG